MPFTPEQSLLRVEVPALHTIDTSSVENLFGMWSLFSKASLAMEDGKRLENLSWRLWNRETFCCAPASRSLRPSAPAQRHVRNVPSSTPGAPRGGDVPSLSSSLESASSSDGEGYDGDNTTTYSSFLRHSETTSDSYPTQTRSRGCEKHITASCLQKMVISIKETKQLQPIDLPISTPASRSTDSSSSAPQTLCKLDLTTHEPPDHVSSSRATLLESSASTVRTLDSNDSKLSQTVGSQDSSSTEMSTHSIVRGFAPSSYRSQTNLAAQPTPILKSTPSQQRQPPTKRKGAMFTIGTSSGEDESSLESHMFRTQLSHLTESLKRPASLRCDAGKKQTSFKDEVNVRKAYEHSPVFESDEEDDDDVSESAIEDDDDSSDWEDSEDQSGPSSVNEKDLFQRVDSRPNLTSRRSLLTTLMHEPERARALQNAASRSTPAIRRSRANTPNGPDSVAASPDLSSPLENNSTENSALLTTCTQQPREIALSPRTTRRNMLSTELTESLRKNLLWERQHRSSGNLAALKRRHTSTDVRNLKQHPEPALVLSQKGANPRKFNNEYFHHGLGEYHSKGW